MKAILFNLSVLVVLSLLVSSCKTESKNDSEPNEIVYDSVSVAKIYHLENDSTKPSCSLKVSYLFPVEYKDTQILTNLQGLLNSVLFEDDKYQVLTPVDAANKYVDDCIANYKNEAKEQFPNWEKIVDGEEYYSSYKTLNSKVMFDAGGLWAYQISSMDYKGDTNAFTSFRNLVFNLQTGNVISEEDIFEEDYKEVLNALLIQKILEQNKMQKTDELIEFGFWGIEDLTSNNNFLVNNEGITYIFNPGEYSAPSLGAATVFVTYKEIKNILKEESPISILFGQ